MRVYISKRRIERYIIKTQNRKIVQKYQNANEAAKKAVAVARVTHYGDVYRKLESCDGERYLYRLAKTRHRQTEDIEKFFGINDESGHLLTKALKRWRDYIEEISAMEFPHPVIPSVASVHGSVDKIDVGETEEVLKMMKPGKATGPDDLAVDVSESKLWCRADGTTIPIWKKKGSPANCSNYRPIRLLSHSMKIFERIVDGRIREIVKLSDNQCGLCLVKITVSETEAALRKMKSGKATGPDDLPADLWKSKGWCPADWLTEFFNQVVAEKKAPESWQQSTTIPIWKKKGSPADCASYRPIRLLLHTMKIFERIVDGRIRDVVQLSTNQCGFVSGCGTVDAIHAARLLLEKHREKQKPVHFAFLDLEKAFDCVSRAVIYSCPRCRVRAPAGTSMEFPISVGVHQGSALSPLLFVVVMDPISRDLQNATPWTLLCADDVMLACEDKTELERQAQAWCDRLALFGLKLNVKKTEYLTTDVDEHGSVKINGTELSRVTSFKYL
ncbi:unnamed protein product [Heligmosomoides polygyrus]|uniref:Reverse transcriptase domain-containing protein n=1 Tax=Heligmosomoides polygyrus TaxID=6339 RepID=A0A183FRI3_HELPZ|nr:unnamed protein product [Heligmosomoides polygyrus]